MIKIYPILLVILAGMTTVFSMPVIALEFKSGNIKVEIETEIRLRNVNNTTDSLFGSANREHDSFIDKIEVAIHALFNNEWFLKSVIETNELATDNKQAPFVNEFYVGKKFEKFDLYAGRFELPFGFYKKAFISDHITKSVGRAKTEAGLGVQGKYNNINWSTTVFTENFRSSEPEQDGFSVYADWSPMDNILIGGGYLSSRRATRGQPQLVNLYGRIKNKQWMVMAEYVGAVNNESGARPSALTIEAEYVLKKPLSIGGRVQKTHDFNVIDGGNGNYTEITLAANYHINKYLKFSVEYIRGREEISGSGSLDTKQALSQLRILF